MVVVRSTAASSSPTSALTPLVYSTLPELPVTLPVTLCRKSPTAAEEQPPIWIPSTPASSAALPAICATTVLLIVVLPISPLSGLPWLPTLPSLMPFLSVSGPQCSEVTTRVRSPPALPSAPRRGLLRTRANKGERMGCGENTGRDEGSVPIMGTTQRRRLAGGGR